MGVDHLMRDSTITPYLVTAAIDRVRSIDWAVIPAESYNESGMYSRSCPMTGKVDKLPMRRVVDVTGFRDLPEVEVPFMRRVNISTFRTMEVLALRMRRLATIEAARDEAFIS